MSHTRIKCINKRVYKQRILLINVYRQFFYLFFQFCVSMLFRFHLWTNGVRLLRAFDLWYMSTCKKNKKQKQKQITAYETLNNFSKSSMLLRKVLIKEAYSGHVHIISYKFWFHFTKYTFPSIFMLSVSLKNFEHYFNVLMEKTTIWKTTKRKYSNSNNKRMSKVLKIDFVLSDDEIQFLHSLANSNFGCYCSRSTLLISPF